MKLSFKLKGHPRVIQIDGKKFEDDTLNGELRVVGDGGELIAKLKTNEVAAWWVEPEFKLSAEDIEEANKVAEEINRYDREHKQE